jgi:hypothetical protein
MLFIEANPPVQILRDWIFIVVGGDYRTRTEEEALNSGTFITPERGYYLIPSRLEHLNQCSVCDPAKIFLTSKSSYFFFYPTPPIKPRLALCKEVGAY